MRHLINNIEYKESQCYFNVQRNRTVHVPTCILIYSAIQVFPKSLWLYSIVNSPTVELVLNRMWTNNTHEINRILQNLKIPEVKAKNNDITQQEKTILFLKTIQSERHIKQHLYWVFLNLLPNEIFFLIIKLGNEKHSFVVRMYYKWRDCPTMELPVNRSFNTQLV